VGEICIHLESPSLSTDTGHNNIINSTVIVSIQTNSSNTGEWGLFEMFTWIGANLDDMPRLHSKKGSGGPPAFQEFPYIDENILGATDYKIRIQIPDITMMCQQSYYLVVHPVLLKNSSLFQNKNSTRQPIEQQKWLLKDQRSKNLTTTIYKNAHMQAPRLRQKRSNRRHQATSQQQSPPPQGHGLWWIEFSMNTDCSADHNTFHSESVESTHHPPFLTPALKNVQQKRRLFEFQKRSTDSSNSSNSNNVTNTSSPCVISPDHLFEPSALLTEDTLYKFHVASMLSLDVSFQINLLDKIDYYRTIYERFNAFDDKFNDAAVVTKVDQTCYAVFRGTVEYNNVDVAQNFVAGYRKVPGTKCYVRRGYYDAYFTTYREKFETEVRDCVASCRNNGTGDDCELILSGASQGAAVAVVASIYLFDEFDPYVYSFGVPRVFLPTSPFKNDKDNNNTQHEECTSFNANKQNHFLLTDSFLKVYDPVPYYPAYWTKYVGREILFDGEGNFNDQGLSTSDHDRYHMKRSPTNIIIHTRWNYYAKTKDAYNNACLPVPKSGWFNGHWCSDDSNCQPTSYCPKDTKVCTSKLQVGDRCYENDASCLSGTCTNNVCQLEQKKLNMIGEACTEAADCESGRCDGLWVLGSRRCKARMESGGRCNQHGDCITGHCIGMFNGKCL